MLAIMQYNNWLTSADAVGGHTAEQIGALPADMQNQFEGMQSGNTSGEQWSGDGEDDLGMFSDLQKRRQTI